MRSGSSPIPTPPRSPLMGIPAPYPPPSSPQAQPPSGPHIAAMRGRPPSPRCSPYPHSSQRPRQTPFSPPPSPGSPLPCAVLGAARCPPAVGTRGDTAAPHSGMGRTPLCAARWGLGCPHMGFIIPLAFLWGVGRGGRALGLCGVFLVVFFFFSPPLPRCKVGVFFGCGGCSVSATLWGFCLLFSRPGLRCRWWDGVVVPVGHHCVPSHCHRPVLSQCRPTASIHAAALWRLWAPIAAEKTPSRGGGNRAKEAGSGVG